MLLTKNREEGKQSLLQDSNLRDLPDSSVSYLRENWLESNTNGATVAASTPNRTEHIYTPTEPTVRQEEAFVLDHPAQTFAVRDVEENLNKIQGF